jgi:hypothetical protein
MTKSESQQVKVLLTTYIRTLTGIIKKTFEVSEQFIIDNGYYNWDAFQEGEIVYNENYYEGSLKFVSYDKLNNIVNLREKLK